MKKLIITGANGQLGRAINVALKDSTEYECVNTDVCEGEGITSLDITNTEQVLAFVESVKPYAVINCAAHTAVDACEDQAESAFLINAIGPRNLSMACTKNGAKMVHVSTDYVLPGDDSMPCNEMTAVRPKGIYGKTKLAGEEFVKSFANEYFILRTAWLYGDGKNFVKTMLRLSETNDKVRVVSDQFGSPTSTKELAKAILYLLPTNNYGLFHATCEGSTNWADFTREIFRLANKSTEVESITTAEFAAKAPRPAYSVLDNLMFRTTTDFTFANWEDALIEYMTEFSLL